jgi:hypothetical protein
MCMFVFGYFHTRMCTHTYLPLFVEGPSTSSDPQDWSRYVRICVWLHSHTYVHACIRLFVEGSHTSLGSRGWSRYVRIFVWLDVNTFASMHTCIRPFEEPCTSTVLVAGESTRILVHMCVWLCIHTCACMDT